MITKDEITMYICSYALFLKEMLMFRCTVAKTATKYPYERKYSSTNEQFWDAFPWQDFFPDISLTVNIIPDISLTCFKFPDISRFSRQVVTLYFNISTCGIICDTEHRVPHHSKGFGNNNKHREMGLDGDFSI